MVTRGFRQRSSIKGGENVQYSTKLLSMAQQTLNGMYSQILRRRLRVPRKKLLLTPQHFWDPILTLELSPETDDRRAAATFQMIEAYEAQQDFAKAEELLVDLWSRFTAISSWLYGNINMLTTKFVNSLPEGPDTRIAG